MYWLHHEKTPVRSYWPTSGRLPPPEMAPNVARVIVPSHVSMAKPEELAMPTPVVAPTPSCPPAWPIAPKFRESR